MTEPTEPDPPPPETARSDALGIPEAAAPPARWRSPRLVAPVLGLIGFLVLAVAIGYLWLRPVPLPPMPAVPPDESGAVSALQSDVATLKTALAALDAREKSDVAALHAAIAQAQPASAPPPAAPPPASPLPAAIDTALQQQVAALSDRLSAIEAAQAKQTQAMPSADTVANLAARIDAIAQREARDGGSLRQDLTLVQQQLASLSGQAQALAKSLTALPQLSAKADRLSQILGAQAALRAGLPLGAITDAPPALARFATTAPPTEAALRVAFPEAAKAAEKAGGAPPDQGRFWHGVWLRVQNLVTVRQGDRVVLGDATGAILAHAQRLLDAGDLSGTLGVLGTLNGPAAAAMAPWEAQARALLDAQQALAKMAAG